jgi:hypothetical protein
LEREKMLEVIAIFILAMGWLLFETDCLRVRLHYGYKSKVYLLPAPKPILMLPVAKNRYSLSMTMAEWKQYEQDYAYTLEQERATRAKQQAENNRHYCPICKKHFDVYVKTKTFSIGNSTFTLTGCPDCITERVDEVTKIQTAKHKPKIIEPQNDSKPTGKRFWEWDEAEYPHTIELEVNGQTISFNGNYKSGCIKQFVKTNKNKFGSEV